MRAFVLALAASLAAAVGFGDSAIPPTPQHYFNDYAHLVSPSDGERLDARLKAFEQESTNQIVVAIFPELPSPSLDDFTIRTAQAWRVGQKKLDNGVVLFVFVKDHKTKLEVGYGLEDKIPDAVAKRILQDVLKPRFKEGNFVAGLDAAIDALVAATRGLEVPARKEPSRTVALAVLLAVLFPAFILLIVLAVLLFRVVKRASTAGNAGGFSSSESTSDWSSGSSSSFSSDSSSSSSSSDFSSGGGSFGGGGASGDW